MDGDVVLIDGWGQLGGRYERGIFQELAEIGEQLAQIRGWLLADSPVRARMAIIQLDSLADSLLWARFEEVLRAGEGGTAHHFAIRVTAAEKRALEKDFRQRVALASKPIKGLFVTNLPALLTAGDAEIFRIAHAYRNPAYHQARDNPQTLPVVARIFFAAFLRAWPRAQPPVGLGRGETLNQQLKPLRDLGLLDPRNDAQPFWFREEVSAIGARLLRGLRVDLTEAKHALANDLMTRVAADQAVLADLDRDGFSRERAAEAVAWGEMWDQLATDPEFISTEKERRELARRLAAAIDAHQISHQREQARLAELQSDHARVVFSRWRTFTPRLSLTLLERVPTRVERLRSSRRMADLLRSYRQLDTELDTLERHLWHTARGWARHLDEESERLRGN